MTGHVLPALASCAACRHGLKALGCPSSASGAWQLAMALSIRRRRSGASFGPAMFTFAASYPASAKAGIQMWSHPLPLLFTYLGSFRGILGGWKHELS